MLQYRGRPHSGRRGPRSWGASAGASALGGRAGVEGPGRRGHVAFARCVRMTLGKSPPVPEPQSVCLQHGEVEPTPRGWKDE